MTRKVYADVKGTVIFVCPNCGDLQKENAATYKSVTGPIKIQCPCGNAYDVQIEFRASYRKEVKLLGRYSTLSTPLKWARMVVKNLSFDGCQFETTAANFLHSGEEIKIEFNLDDLKNSLIKKTALVRHVQGHSIGCNFKEFPGTFDPELGFYLR